MATDAEEKEIRDARRSTYKTLVEAMEELMVVGGDKEQEELASAIAALNRAQRVAFPVGEGG